MAKYLGFFTFSPVIELTVALEQPVTFDKNFNVGNDTLFPSEGMNALCPYKVVESFSLSLMNWSLLKMLIRGKN